MLEAVLGGDPIRTSGSGGVPVDWFALQPKLGPADDLVGHVRQAGVDEDIEEHLLRGGKEKKFLAGRH